MVSSGILHQTGKMIVEIWRLSSESHINTILSLGTHCIQDRILPFDGLVQEWTPHHSRDEKRRGENVKF